MNLQLKINKRLKHLKITFNGSRPQFSLNGQGVAADIVEIGPDTFSVLLDGEVFRVRVSPLNAGIRIEVGELEFLAELQDSRRWRRAGTGSASAEGRQNITAPMPGKVVRLLVKIGEKVRAGQGLLIVEAMKMQNEIKSPKDGTIEKISAAEGNPVNAGEILAVIV